MLTEMSVSIFHQMLFFFTISNHLKTNKTNQPKQQQNQVNYTDNKLDVILICLLSF